MILPKLILTDIDGVWTDGGMYYGNSGLELKKFHTYDSSGIIMCSLFNIKTGIITGENTEMVELRSKKLKVDFLFQGVRNKLKVTKELLDRLNISFSEVAYIGDDIADLPLLKEVGISGCPQNAPSYIKKNVTIITKSPGGFGAFREFVEYIFQENNILDIAIEKMENNINGK